MDALSDALETIRMMTRDRSRVLISSEPMPYHAELRAEIEALQDHNDELQADLQTAQQDLANAHAAIDSLNTELMAAHH